MYIFFLYVHMVSPASPACHLRINKPKKNIFIQIVQCSLAAHHFLGLKFWVSAFRVSYVHLYSYVTNASCAPQLYICINMYIHTPCVAG